jgi:hypothetical protein
MANSAHGMEGALKMNGDAKKVACPACGHIMTIPPEYANTPGRCGKCGAVVNEQPLMPAIDLSDLDRPARKPPAASIKKAPEPFGPVVVRSMLMGLAGAAAGGTILGTYSTVRRAAGQNITVGTLFASANMGLVLGFTVCSLYVLVKHLNWGPLKAAAGGLVICGVSATLMFAIEATFVAPSEMGILSEIFMAGLAGGVAGLVLGAKLNSEA